MSKRAIAALEAQRAVLGDDVVNTMVAAAREKLAALEAQRTAEQRKQVTVLFADMGAEGERARTLRAWARYNMGSGDLSRGKIMWQEARELCTKLEMELEVERMAQDE